MEPASALLDLAAVAVFAVTGAIVASHKAMDPFGFALLATVTGIGGGTIRDLLLGLPVFWVADPAPLLVCVGASVVVYMAGVGPARRLDMFVWLDALGLAAVAAVGAAKALDADAGPVVAVVMGVITGAFGGIIRDVLGGEVPMVLRRDIYATAALVAATVLVLADRLGATREQATTLGFVAGFLVRAMAIRYSWSLPAHRGEDREAP